MQVKIDGIKCSGLCSAVPKESSSVKDFCDFDDSDAAKFSNVTGVLARRVAPEGICSSDLVCAAAENLIKALEWKKSDIRILVFVTQTGEYPIPSSAILLQDKLSLGKETVAFDINLGCSGFPYGLFVVASLLKAYGFGKALLLMGDVSSRMCGRGDRSTWPLFGDAGSAVGLELQPGTTSPFFFDLNSDGSGFQNIIVPSGNLASRNPITSAALKPVEVESGIFRSQANLSLDGANVFSFAISRAPKSISRVLDFSGMDNENIRFCFLHQANRMINKMIAKKVKQPHWQFPSTLESFGNTSSASIPLTISHEALNTALDGWAIACGFGVGLSWGSVIFDLSETLSAGIIDL